MFDRRGLMFVLSSPSGAGKTTIAKEILKRDSNLEFSISETTRPIRPNETDHKNYHFIDEKQFHKHVDEGRFLEHAKVFNNYYGTPKDPVKNSLKQGKDVLFDIDWQGARQLGRKVRGDLVSVFILPPSIEILEKRLRARALDKNDVILERMSRASSEIIHWIEYGYVVINDDLEKATDQVHSILNCERLRRRRQYGLDDFVSHMTGLKDE